MTITGDRHNTSEIVLYLPKVDQAVEKTFRRESNGINPKKMVI